MYSNWLCDFLVRKLENCERFSESNTNMSVYWKISLCSIKNKNKKETFEETIKEIGLVAYFLL